MSAEHDLLRQAADRLERSASWLRAHADIAEAADLDPSNVAVAIARSVLSEALATVEPSTQRASNSRAGR